MAVRSRSLASAIRKAVRQCDLRFCLQCGVCSAVCPLPEVFDDLPYFALPRAIVRRIAFARLPAEDARALLGDARFWYCLTCDECARSCPAGVKLNEFAARMHHLAVGNGIETDAVICADCGTFFSTRRAIEHASRVFLKVKDEKSDSRRDAPAANPGVAQSLRLCPKCRLYSLGGKLAGKRLQVCSPVRGARLVAERCRKPLAP